MMTPNETESVAQRVYSMLPVDRAHRVDTWTVLSGDYAFKSMDDVDAILSLLVGGEYSNGYAIWQRRS